MDRFNSTLSIEELKAKAKNKNTTKSTSQWMRVYLSWANLRNKEKEIERLAPETLDEILQLFFTEIKKKDGTDYEPSSLANMQAALDRYLKEAGYQYSLFTSRHSLQSRNVLEGKAKMLREEGKRKQPNKSESLTDEEVETLT